MKGEKVIGDPIAKEDYRRRFGITSYFAEAWDVDRAMISSVPDSEPISA